MNFLEVPAHRRVRPQQTHITMTIAIAVCIGRFQPFHLAHAAMLKRALALAPQVVVVLGSAFQARTPRNPFTWTERAEMIRGHFSDPDQARLQFLPVRDAYDEARWALAVQRGVEKIAGDVCGRRIALVAHLKDASSSYLKAFPNWDRVPLDLVIDTQMQQPIHASSLRDAWWAEVLKGSDCAQTLSSIAQKIPPSTLDFLQRWVRENPDALTSLVEHWQFLQQYKAAWARAPHPPIFVTVDALVTCQNHVLLIRRGQAPGQGLLALPGGFVEQRESLYASAVRELHEETQLNLSPGVLARAWRQTVVFDHPGRSQRGRTITHTHHFELDLAHLPSVTAADDAASASWIALHQLPALEDQFHDDHFHMLDRLLGLLPSDWNQSPAHLSAPIKPSASPAGPAA
jgi:bifunctional NMN adenylyltransferase/nudix hydrolase